jgi:hypothetical protein
MNPRTLFALLSSVALASQGFAQSTTVQGEPFGYVKVNITAGTGTTKRTTLLSIPLLDEVNITGKSSGRITGLTANTITAEGAGWQSGQLSTVATPRLIEITSGEAQGRMLLISTTTANTSDTVTLASAEVPRVGDLTNLNIKVGAQDGDTYRIRPVHTLSSFFGTPESRLVQGGTSPSNADTIIIVVNGVSSTYFFNTTLGRWTQVLVGSPDASLVPIPPFAGVQYARLGDTALEFIVTGKVPSGQREVSIKNSGVTILSSFWPVGQTLAQLGLQNTPNWKTGASVGAADTVVLTTGGSTATYYHNGTSWIRSLVGGGNSDNVTVPVGTSLLINKRGSAPDFASYEHSAPYNLQ